MSGSKSPATRCFQLVNSAKMSKTPFHRREEASAPDVSPILQKGAFSRASGTESSLPLIPVYLIVKIFFELFDLRLLCFSPLFSGIVHAHAESSLRGSF